ncbi:MAG TPA: hypothetical protein VFB96_03210, partial [Pirellulaceae bacterium]|nr:hypothetical protein [Pirellulaceae bacterium]
MLLTKKTLVLVFALVGACWLCMEYAPAQEKKGGAEDPTETEQRQQTRATMLARWNKLRAVMRIAGKEKEVERVAQPVFSYSEPTRETGGIGTLWVWGTRGRPAALLAQSKADGRPVWGYELMALAEAVSVEMHDGWKWTPKSALQMTPFADAPRAADSDVRRLAQMKSLVEKFTLSEQYRDQSFELRLLPRPVYRYDDEEDGLIDGAIFNFAHGTNPEILAVIECRKEDSGSAWSYGFLPLSGAAVTAKLDGKTVWSKEQTRESKAQELYSTWLETE